MSGVTAPVRVVADATQIPTVVTWATARLDAGGYIAADIETTGLDILAPTFAVTDFAFGSDNGTAWYLDGANVTLIRDTLAAVYTTLRDRGSHLYAHNVKYEQAAFAAVYGLKLPRMRCSMEIVRAAMPGYRGRDGMHRSRLKALCPETEEALIALATEMGRAHYPLPEDPTTDRGWLTDVRSVLGPTHPAMLAYVAADAVASAELVAEVFNSPDLNAHNKAAVALAADYNALTTWRVTRGWNAQPGPAEAVLAKKDALSRQSLEQFGVDLLSSSHATKEWVCARVANPVPANTEKYTAADLHTNPTLISINKDLVGKYRPKPGYEADVAEFKRLRKEQGAVANAKTMLDAITSGGGQRVFAAIDTMGTDTGRTAGFGPNLLAMNDAVKSCLLVDHPDAQVLIGGDFGQLEPRTFALMSQDPDFIEAVKGDVHLMVAIAAFDPDGQWLREAYHDKDHPRHGEAVTSRNIAKRVEMMVLYGAGVNRVQSTLDCSRDDAARIRSSILDAFPGAARWAADIRSRCEQNDVTWLEAYHGLLVAVPRSMAYTGSVSTLVQASGMEIVKDRTIRVVRRLGLESWWLNVHDESLFCVPVTQADAGVAVINDEFNFELVGSRGLHVPFVSEGSVLGQYWKHA